jgi:hypothetical protein
MSLRDHIAGLPFVDTHSHMAGGDFGSPADDRGGKNLPQVLMADHLRYLLESQGAAPEMLKDYRQWRPDDAEAQMRVVLPLLDRLRHLTAYAVVREGVRELYPFTEEDIGENNWRRINGQVLAAYRRHGERAWQRAVLRRARVVLQNQMVELPYVTDHWDSLPPDERAAQKRSLLPSLVLDGYLFSGFAASTKGRHRSEELLGQRPRTHSEHLAFLEKVLDLFLSRGGRSVKLMTAYHRTLRFEPVPDLEAERLFARGPEELKGEGLHRLQDNLCWHLLALAARRGLPLIVHTGYAVPTDWGHPEHLVPLLTSPRLAGMKFDLSHSGWPHQGEAMVLARTYPNCYLNLCWTPLLSRALGRRVLSEAIDMLPADKLLVGTDTGTAEAFLGAVWLIRSLLTEVLEEKVRGGQFGADAAKRVACAVLLDNPLAFYGMTEEQVPSLEADPAAGCAPDEAQRGANIRLPFLDPEG